ncbi:TrmB family transcriptional regulator [Halomicroarcula sp. GCM10025817]|uniref:TrmB family transcriptional regulator n=1 Tax=Halomicroarcula sp. GCM10025817 TaxID=3252672 RepID=UPI00361C3F18
MSPPQNKSRAIEELQAVGLTEYEAKCFVALSQIPSGTATDVSEIVDIPRTRIYDIAESLQDCGLVEIQKGTPREFRAVSTDVAMKRLQLSHREHLDNAAKALRQLTTPDVRDEASGVWRIEGKQKVAERGQYIAARAETELFGLFTEDAVFQDDCFRQAQSAIDRGVDVVLSSPDEDLRESLRARFPDATIWDPSLDWQTLEEFGAQVSRLVMADRHTVMLASLSKDDGDCAETAIWGEGSDSELVVLCRELVGAQLDELDAEDGSSRFSL